MKVAMFHATLPEPDRKPGGVEVAVHRLANALAASGEIEVKVYSLTGHPPDAVYDHQRLYQRLPWLRRNPFGRLLILPVLLNFVRFAPAEVIHFHGDDWFFFRRKLPTVRTLHGSALFEARAAKSWKRKIEQYCVYPLEWLSSRLCRSSLGIGRAATTLYRTTYMMDNGVDTDLFRTGAKTLYPQILYVGTWAGRKRGEFLYNLFVRDVQPLFPEARLCMVCDYCPRHRGVIDERFPSDNTLARLYRESWVFAYPSTYEGFGISYIEAMSSGTAVLSSPNDGAKYVLGDGKYGVIADDADFARCLLELLSKPEWRNRLASAGRKRAAEFSWQSVAARHKTIYRESINV